MQFEAKDPVLDVGSDQAYTDKLDGKISEDFWQRKMTEWQAEEQRVGMALAGLQESISNDRLLDAKRILNSRTKRIFCILRGNWQNKPNCSE